MLIPGGAYQAATATNYRHGFNGQEKDDEIKGAGKSYTAEFWEYDPRIGRRWNQDPRPNVGMSTYSAFANNPISNVDPLGDTMSVEIMTNAENRTITPFKYYDKALHDDEGKVYNPTPGSFGEETLNAFNKMANSGDFGKFLIESITSAPNMPVREATISAHQGAVLYLNPNAIVEIPTADGNVSSPFFIVAGHEIGYAYLSVFGPNATLAANYANKWYDIDVSNPNNPDMPVKRDISKDEIFASFIENRLRSENKLPLRTYYSPVDGGGVVQESSLTSQTATHFIQNNQDINIKFNTWLLEQVHQRSKIALPAQQNKQE